MRSEAVGEFVERYRPRCDVMAARADGLCAPLRCVERGDSVGDAEAGGGNQRGVDTSGGPCRAVEAAIRSCASCGVGASL